MKASKSLMVLAAMALAVVAAQAQQLLYSITACPGQDASTTMHLSWAADPAAGDTHAEYAVAGSNQWRRAALAQDDWCTTYHGISSKRPDGTDFTEDAQFRKMAAVATGLKPNTPYVYRIVGNGAASPEHHFTTAGSPSWSAAIISDFHTYAPLPNRLHSAMGMLDVVKRKYDDVDWVMHIGDVVAWGGSYSFWQQMYEQPAFAQTMWAGLNGNHDNMSRKYEQLTNAFFRDAAYYPRNGYGSEQGVCYWFTYHNVLFIMLNSEVMRDEQGLLQAQQWVRQVVKENRHAGIDFTVVAEHYQWFFGTDGKTSQYGRWCQVMDELGIDLAIGANNHIYARTVPLLGGRQVPDNQGTTYVQLPSSDDERGQEPYGELQFNADKIAARWNEGPHTVGAMHLSVDGKRMRLDLVDRNGNVVDTFRVRKHAATR